jgi:tetratricopeptide (TPR) repeat protein
VDLHERYAEWLDGRAGGGAVEFDEIVGYHLERSATLALELAPGDEGAWDTAARAAIRLGVAGNRALERGDLPAAASLLERADKIDRSDSAGRLRALLDLGVVFERQGRYDEAVDALQRAEDLAGVAGDRSIAARAVIRRQFTRAHVDRVGQSEQHAEVEALLPEIEASGDLASMAEASYYLGVSSFWMGQVLRAMELLERAQDLAVRARLPRVAEEAAGWYLGAVLSAPLPAADAVERWHAVSSSIPMSRYGRAFGEAMTALAIAMTGDVDTARAWCIRGREAVRELGDETQTYASAIILGQIELLAGDFEAAERELAEGERGLERLGEDGFRSSVLVLRADALQALRRTDEAIAASERSEAIAVDDDYEALAGWRSARARAFADLGRFPEAEALSRQAIDLLLETQSIDEIARGWSSLAYVLACIGRGQEAMGAYREALERFELKGTVLSVARVERTMAVLRGEDPGRQTVRPGAWGTSWPIDPVTSMGGRAR